MVLGILDEPLHTHRLIRVVLKETRATKTIKLINPRKITEEATSFKNTWCLTIPLHARQTSRNEHAHKAFERPEAFNLV